MPRGSTLRFFDADAQYKVGENNSVCSHVCEETWTSVMSWAKDLAKLHKARCASGAYSHGLNLNTAVQLWDSENFRQVGKVLWLRE